MMKRAFFVLVVLLVVGVSAHATVVPNGDFNKLYKPGQTVITADIGVGCINGVGGDVLVRSVARQHKIPMNGYCFM